MVNPFLALCFSNSVARFLRKASLSSLVSSRRCASISTTL